MSDGSSVDDGLIAAQLGRPQRAESTVASRCALKLPVVIAVPPTLESGEPFPTRYWLSCPLAHKRIARMESAGGVRAYEERARTDAAFADALGKAHAAYAEERDALVAADTPIRPRGGVAGVSGMKQGVKCLHAHYAHFRAGGDNPIGREVAGAIEPLDCSQPCVVETEGGHGKNPAWRQPRPELLKA